MHATAASFQLKRFLRRSPLQDCLLSVACELGVEFAVTDPQGTLILGLPSATDSLELIRMNGRTVGAVAVSGSMEAARILSTMISSMAAQELEKKRLAHEALHGYEHMGVLQDLCRSLSRLTKATQAASCALEALQHLTDAQGGCVAAKTGAKSLRLLSCIGDSEHATTLLVNNSPFVTQALVHGNGELLTDSRQDRRIGDSAFSSIMCAPMTWGGEINGLVVLGAMSRDAFNANDYGLLSQVALMTGAAVMQARYRRMLCSTNTVLDNPQAALTS